MRWRSGLIDRGFILSMAKAIYAPTVPGGIFMSHIFRKWLFWPLIALPSWVFGHVIQLDWIQNHCGSRALLESNARICRDNIYRLRFGGLVVAAILLILVVLIRALILKSTNEGASLSQTKLFLTFQALYVCILSLVWHAHAELLLLATGLMFLGGLIFSLRRECQAFLMEKFPPSDIGLQNAPRPSRFLHRLVIFAFVVHATVALSGFKNSIVDHHSFRQTQTALTTYYLVKDGFRIDYQTPIFGKPWAVPMEFPLYQYVVAAGSRFFHANIEFVSRLVSLISFYLLALLTWFFLKAIRISSGAALLVLGFLLLAPLHLFFSRTALMETFSTMLGMGWLFFAVSYFRTRKASHLVTGLLFATAVALSKITTFVVFSFALAGIFLAYAEKPFRKNLEWRNLLRYGALGLVLEILPLALGFWWVKYADALKEKNPLGTSWTSTALKEWNFGKLSQRIDPVYLKSILVTDTHKILGYLGAIVLALVIVRSIKARRSEVKYWSRIFMISFLAGPIIFSNLYLVHDYYYVACAVFLLMALGIQVGIYYDEADATTRKHLRNIVILPIVISMLAGYWGEYGPHRLNSGNPMEKIGTVVQKNTAESDIVILYNAGPEIPYYSKRRSVLLNFGGDAPDDVVQGRVLKNLSDEVIGAVLIPVSTRPEIRKQIMKLFVAQYSFAPVPTITIEGTEIYTKP
jgi:hypothetical protein